MNSYITAMKLSYKIVIQTDGSQKTTQFIYSENIDNAKKMAVTIAERMGGSFLDIRSVELASFVDDKKGCY
jgi:hypothetical protein